MLARRTALRSRPRSRGNRGEREVIDLLHEYGWNYARRNLLSGGLGGGDIVEGIPGTTIEVKFCESCRIWEWLKQCEAAAKPTDIPLLIFRRNRHPWYACMPRDDMEELLERVDHVMITRWSNRAVIWDWIAEAAAEAKPSEIPVVAFRRTESGWYCVAPLERVLWLLRERETALP